jgi:tetratricopeptide (TPR) repeat protein
MKSLILAVLFVFTGTGAFAQKLDKAKDLLKTNKLTEAKTEVENFLAVEKNKTNSEAWYTKAKVYTAISKDSTLKGSVPNAREVAYDALKQYIQLESTVKEKEKRQMSLTLDNRQPFVDLYAGYSKDGASFYNANNYNDALANFKQTLDIFDFMAQQGWTNNIVLDTTTTLYAGISAEKANKLDEAATYYGKIAERKATGEGFIEIYKWLADYYKQKGDVTNSQKFVDLGKELYPTDAFWSGFELDMLREKGTKDQLFAKYEEIIGKYPDNHLFLFNYAVELYTAGYNVDMAKRPANSKELIKKATDMTNKALALKPDYANANMLMGQILYNDAADIAAENKLIRPPQGGKLKPEELKKKEELRQAVNKKYDEAIPYFEKVDALLGSQGKLKMEEKGYLKDSYDLLITIYETKGNTEKAAAYTDKFNNVDKKH